MRRNSYDKKSDSACVSFWGDVAPCREYSSQFCDINARPFSGIETVLAEMEFSICNLECPLYTGSHPILKIGPNLKGPLESAAHLVQAGFSAVGLSNNHIMDYGIEGLVSTIKQCESAELSCVGAAENASNARAVLYRETSSGMIAVIAISDAEFSEARQNMAGAASLDFIETSKQITEARSLADFVFVYFHGGIELYQLPSPELKRACRFFVEQGADAVVCHHPHVIGPIEIYNNSPIFYSLGNLIFDHPNPPAGWAEGYGVAFSLNKESKQIESFTLIPYSQSATQLGVSRMNNVEESKFEDSLQALIHINNDEQMYQENWRTYVASVSSRLIGTLYSPWVFRGLGVVLDMFPGWLKFAQRRSLLYKLNLIGTASHRELIEESIRNELDKRSL